jgi:pimeloyl-ACP methyl ester carboxylesterase
MPYTLWNHRRIFYREKGSGPLLVLLPGNTSSSVNMQADLAHFSSRFKAVALDFLGTGRSDRLDYWTDDWWLSGAHQVNQLVRHLGYDKCILVGTSGGAVTALLAAIHHPEIVRGVVADSFIPYLTQEMLENHLIPDRTQPQPGQILFWEAAHGPYWKQVVDADTAMIERFVRRGGDWFKGQFDRVRCPVLLTASKVDPVLPGVAGHFADMAEQIQGSRIYLHHEGQHPLIWSVPGIFRGVSDLFLDSLR